jgi:hypothetical protein
MQKSLKFQAPNIKSQTNPNDPNSKIQTKDASAVVPNAIIPGSPDFTSRRVQLWRMFWSLNIEI